MQRIEGAVGSLSELLDQLLDLSKLEAGAVQAAQQDFAVRDLLSAIETEFASLARVKGIELRVLPTDAWLRSDLVLVRRILSNLVANAIRYTERGGVLRLSQARTRSAHCGSGIPLRIPTIVEDVFRDSCSLRARAASRRSVPPRLGLGLSIVARLAELLGTKLSCARRSRRGSMFAF